MHHRFLDSWRQMLSGAALALIASNTATAQVTVAEFFGTDPGGRFGSGVGGGGDANGDGHGDVIVGSDDFGFSPSPVGAVFVYSGADGSTLHELYGSPGEGFGAFVAFVGDANGDGFDDFAATAPGAEARRGRLSVFSGRTGKSLFVFVGEVSDAGLSRVAAAGDVDADGFDDVIGGAPFDTSNGRDYGTVYVLGGRDGAVLHRFEGSYERQGLGIGVAGIGDVNQDGFADLLIGENNSTLGIPGGAFVRSGRDGSVIYSLDGASPGDRYGGTVGALGDVTGDGIGDFVIGAYNDIRQNVWGSVQVLSGATGTLVRQFFGSNGNTIGLAVAGVGDMDGDGLNEVAIGALDSVFVYSGGSFDLLFDFQMAPRPTSVGDRIAGAGDTDGDGFDEIIVGDVSDASFGIRSGVATVVGEGLVGSPPIVREVGAACAGSDLRLPSISHVGRPFVGTEFTIGLRAALPSPLPAFETAALCVGLPIEPPIALDIIGLTGCTLHVAAFVCLSSPVDALGFASVDLGVDCVGVELAAQWAVMDADANNFGVVLSDALLLRAGFAPQ